MVKIQVPYGMSDCPICGESVLHSAATAWLKESYRVYRPVCSDCLLDLFAAAISGYMERTHTPEST